MQLLKPIYATWCSRSKLSVPGTAFELLELVNTLLNFCPGQKPGNSEARVMKKTLLIGFLASVCMGLVNCGSSGSSNSSGGGATAVTPAGQCGGTVYVPGYGALQQGSCAYGQGWTGSTCVAGTPTTNTNCTNSCIAGQINTQYGCMPTAGCQANYGMYNGSCVQGFNLGYGTGYGTGYGYPTTGYGYGQQYYQTYPQYYYNTGNTGYYNSNYYGGYNGGYYYKPYRRSGLSISFGVYGY